GHRRHRVARVGHAPQAAGRGVAVHGASGVERVGAGGADVERVEAGRVLRRDAGHLVDLAVAVVVLPVGADLGEERAHRRVVVVAVVASGAVAVGIAVAVGVPGGGRARLGRFDTLGDVALVAGAAGDGRAGDAAVARLTDLHPVAVDAVLALGVV